MRRQRAQPREGRWTEQAHEEEEDDGDDEDGAVAQRAEDVPERDLDEVGLPEDAAVDLHALGEGPLDGVELRVEPLPQRERVPARLLLDPEHDPRPPVVGAFPELHGGADAHVPEVPHEHRLRAAQRDHRLAEVGRRAGARPTPWFRNCCPPSG